MAIAEPTNGIDIRNLGPIEHLHIPLSDCGSVVVLTGRNGAGKSHALDAVSRLGGNKKISPPIRDGEKRAEVDGCGVHLVVGSRVSSIGELEFQSIEGKFDLSKLVDPGIASVDSANAARIKQLLTISDLEADESWFHDLAGGKDEFEAMAIKPSDDVVELAGRVKRGLEDRARKLEAEAERLSGQHATRMADVQEYGPEVERDTAKLNAMVEAAITAKAAIDERRKNFEAESWRQKEAREKLAALPDSNLAVLESEVAICTTQFTSVCEEVDALEAQIKELKDALQAAESKRAYANVQLTAAREAVEAEKRRCSDREAFEKLVAIELTPGPTDAEIAEKADALAEARSLAELGTMARRADTKAAEARELKQQELACRAKAESLRNSARGTDEVLSDLVAKLGVDLVVHEGVLSVQTDRGYEPFAELSHGERWKIAIQLGQLRVGSGGLLPIPQEAWESLDPANRQIVADAARRYRVQVITAEAADGDLRAESYRTNGAR